MAMTTCLTGAVTRSATVYAILLGEKNINTLALGGSLLTANQPHCLH
jgi:hypothetical protein